ncbi:hypothetical protein PF002_g10292 [Phytophthora fragariae]|uniref:Reverse transcriptase Ty1/copia-type domain-containing protein n=1 Tax=Phytophthora fragariae TaxID=53985 RepID=A0A6A3ZQQ3_9STRA|nr:hypothetical protein PF002_g10292 [Phytophthora fragariae]
MKEEINSLIFGLYGLKQASRAWYQNLTAFVISCGFTEGKADTFLFVKIDGAELMIALVYVDACSCLGRVTRRWHRSSSLWRTLML